MVMLKTFLTCGRTNLAVFLHVAHCIKNERAPVQTQEELQQGEYETLLLLRKSVFSMELSTAGSSGSYNLGGI